MPVRPFALFAPVVIATLVAGCTPSLPALPDLPGLGPTRVDLFPGVTLGIPRGYCLNREASRIAEDGSALLLGRCNDAVGAVPAVLRLSMGAPGSAGVLAAKPADLAAFFTSAAGRASLSPSGRADDVRILKALSAGPDFLLLIASPTEGSYWRAITAVSGRLVTVSAIGTKEVPLSADDSRALVDRALAAQTTP